LAFFKTERKEKMKMKKLLATVSAVVLCTATGFTTAQPFGTTPAAVVSAASSNFASQSVCSITRAASYQTGRLNFDISRNYGLKFKTMNVCGVKSVTGEWFFPTGIQLMVEKNGSWDTLNRKGYRLGTFQRGYQDTANINDATVHWINLDFTEMTNCLINGRYLKISVAPVCWNGQSMKFPDTNYYAPAVYFDYYAKKVVSESVVYR
jgi:hypothetical protein